MANDEKKGIDPWIFISVNKLEYTGKKALEQGAEPEKKLNEHVSVIYFF